MNNKAIAKLPILEEEGANLSEETLALIDHVGEILAEEYVHAMKLEEKHEGSHLCEILKRQPTRAKYRRPSPCVP